VVPALSEVTCEILWYCCGQTDTRCWEGELGKTKCIVSVGSSNEKVVVVVGSYQSAKLLLWKKRKYKRWDGVWKEKS